MKKIDQLKSAVTNTVSPDKFISHFNGLLSHQNLLTGNVLNKNYHIVCYKYSGACNFFKKERLLQVNFELQIMKTLFGVKRYFSMKIPSAWHFIKIFGRENCVFRWENTTPYV